MQSNFISMLCRRLCHPFLCNRHSLEVGNILYQMQSSWERILNKARKYCKLARKAFQARWKQCSPIRRGVVLGTPGGGRVDAARGWQAAEHAARPPRPLRCLLGAAWAAVGGVDARARGGRLSGRRWAWRSCGACAPPRGHARGRQVWRCPAAAIPLVSIYRIGGLVSHCT